MNNKLPNEFHFLLNQNDEAIKGELDINAFRQYARSFVGTITQSLKNIGKPVEYRDIVQWGMRIEKLFWLYCEQLMERDETVLRLKDTIYDSWECSRDEIHRQFKQNELDTQKVTMFYLGLHKCAELDDPIANELIRFVQIDSVFRHKLTTYVFGAEAIYYA